MTPEKVRVETKTVEVEKIIEKIVHKETKVTEHPDGTKETVVVEDSNTIGRTESTKNTYTKESISKGSKVNISILGGIKSDLNTVVYGASVSKELIGPITIGAWGLTDKTFGISVGLNL